MALTIIFLPLLLLLLINTSKFHFTERDLYNNLSGRYCIRKLNESGTFGCASHYNGAKGKLKLFLSTEILQNAQKSQKGNEKIVAIIPAFMLNKNTVQTLKEMFELSGILVLDQKTISGQFSNSPERQNPFKDNAPDGYLDKDWNVYGDSLMFENLKFPVYMMRYEDSVKLLKLVYFLSL